MELKLDISKPYAVALEGGGARGAYEVGAWKALAEAGVRYNAVSGTSVGALNGALMAMGDLELALDIWENICFSRVMDVSDEEMRKLYSLDLGLGDIFPFLKRMADLIRSRGLDVSPLRRWINETVDEARVKNSGVDFYLTTYSLTDRKSLELRAADLEPGQLGDMLLASAYHPAFRNEKLGGKRYTDGGLQDVVPVHALVKNGYRDIIVIRIFGFGLKKLFRMPKDARIITIAPGSELGGILNFDREQTTKDLELGYYDAKRVLYGLYGEKYYTDRTWDELRAYGLLRVLAEKYAPKGPEAPNLRELNEKVLPKLAKELGVRGGYYELLIACMEKAALALGVPRMAVRTDTEFMGAIKTALVEKKLSLPEAVALVLKR